jgi:uncharacterized protein YkwD
VDSAASPLPPLPTVGGSADWWRERLRAAGVSRPAAPQAGTDGPLASRAAVPPQGAATAPIPPVRPSPRRATTPAPVVIPTPQTVHIPATGTLARDVTPEPRRWDLAGLARTWREHHLLPIAVGALLLAAVVLLWAPGRRIEGEPQRSVQAPAIAPQADDPPQAQAPPSPVADQASPSAAGGASDPSPAPAQPAAAPPGASGDAACAGSECDFDQAAGAELLEAINAQRARNGQQELASDEDLVTVARAHVREMAAEDRLFHTSNELLGERVTNWTILAESIGVGSSVGSLMDEFLRSEVDRTNLLDPKFRHIGVAAVRQGDRLWVTVLFSDANDPGTTLSE